jgi:hypothetical protein
MQMRLCRLSPVVSPVLRPVLRPVLPRDLSFADGRAALE